MAKKPAFQFYPGDWRKDPNLSRASLEAKGAMIEIMCLAFDCERRGMLVTDKTPWTIEEIAHAIGGDKIKNVQAIEELLTKKVLKKDKKGVIFSSRMVKDEKLSKVRRAAGFKGGNPVLLKHVDIQGINQKPTPSSSSSSSPTSVNNTNTPALIGFGYDLKTLLPENVLEAAERSQVTMIGKKHTEFIKSQWLVFISERMNESPRKYYGNISDMTSHFLNWIRNKHPKKTEQAEEQIPVIRKSMVRL